MLLKGVRSGPRIPTNPQSVVWGTHRKQWRLPRATSQAPRSPALRNTALALVKQAPPCLLTEPPAPNSASSGWNPPKEETALVGARAEGAGRGSPPRGPCRRSSVLSYFAYPPLRSRRDPEAAVRGTASLPRWASKTPHRLGTEPAHLPFLFRLQPHAPLPYLVHFVKTNQGKEIRKIKGELLRRP